MFERFTDRARRANALAQDEARLLNHDFIGTEHLLLGLLRVEDGLAAKALSSFGISLEAVREKVKETIGPVDGERRASPPFTPRAKKVLELSLREAIQLGHDHIGTGHELLGLVREGEGVAVQILRQLGATWPSVRSRTLELLASNDPEDGSPRPASHVELFKLSELVHAGRYADVSLQGPGRLVFSAGVCPLNEQGKVTPVGDLPGQTEQAMANLVKALAAAGSSLTEVLKLTVYVTGTRGEDLAAAWNVVTSCFDDRMPPGTVVGVTSLGYENQLVEIDAVAQLSA